MSEHEIVFQTYHIFMLVGGIAGVFGLIWRTWLAPIKQWRKDVEEKNTALRHEFELFKQRVDGDLKRGDEKFDTLSDEIHRLSDTISELKETIISLKTAFKGSVFKGVGE